MRLTRFACALFVVGIVFALSGSSIAPAQDAEKTLQEKKKRKRLTREEKQERRRRRDVSPAVGAEAKDFELVTLESILKKEKRQPNAGGDAKKTVKLSSFKGKQPVVFVLTSYT